MLASKINDFFTSHIPQYNTKKYVLAVSGGMDSMLMLEQMLALHLTVVVAHCNFNLRGDESQGDEGFVRDTCMKLSVPFYIKHFDTQKEKEAQHEGTQLIARKLRYHWFEELRHELGYDFICTAHHSRDNAETLIHRFMQGAYPESMQGIKPVNGTIIRPMINFSYSELLALVATNAIQYRTDHSNLSQEYTRNKIRHTILPALAQVFGDNYAEKISSIAPIYTVYHAFIKQQADQLLRRKNNWYEINIALFRQIRGHIALLYEALKNYGFNWKQCEDICSNLSREQGTVYENNDRTFNLYFASAVLQLVPVLNTNSYAEFLLDESAPKEILYPYEKLTLTVVSKEKPIDYKPSNLYLDYDLVKHKNICIRTYEPHDMFTPLGMNGVKSVSDFLKDLKLTPAEKQYQQVLCINEQVVCVLGKRVCEVFKVTDRTKFLLVLELKSI